MIKFYLPGPLAHMQKIGLIAGYHPILETICDIRIACGHPANLTSSKVVDVVIEHYVEITYL